MKLFELLGKIVVNNKEANDEVDKTAEKAEEASSKISKAFSSIGGGVVKGVGGAAKIATKTIAGIGAAAATGIGAFLATAESTKEFRQEVAKLENVAKQTGTHAEYIRSKWLSMSSVLGDEGAVTEGLNNIMAAGFTTQESIDGITQVLEGAALKWKDTLKFEGLADGLQETLAVGEATGSFAEMLERSGIVLDDFNAGLANCSTEAEKQQYIMDTLATTGLADVSKAYREANREMIDAERAQMQLTSKIAEIGAIAEPIMTTLKWVAVDLLDTIMPFVELIGNGLQGALSGTAGAAEQLGEGLSGGIAAVLDTIVGALPTVITTLSSMAPTLIQAISDSIGQILTVISESGPEIMGLFLDVVMGLVNLVVENVPLLIEAFISLFSALVERLPEILPQLLEGLLSIITTLAEQLPTMVPMLVQALVSMFMALVNYLPQFITALITLITSLLSALVEQLPVILPALIEGLTSLLLGLIEQLPTIIDVLIQLLIQIITIIAEQMPVILPQLLDAVVQIVFALIEALPTILMALITALPAILQGIWDTIIGIFEGLATWFGDLFSKAVELIKNAFSAIGSFFSGIWQNIKGAFSNVASWFGDIFSQAWSNIKSAFSNFASFFSGLWDKIKSTFSALGTKLGDAIGGAVKSGINGVLSIIENAINSGIGLINGAIGLINKIPGVSIGKFSTVSLPRLASGGVLYDDTAFIGGEYANAATNPEIVTPQNIMAETFDKVLTAKLSLISDLQNDRLDRILELLSDYIPQLGNQQIVLDTGALVGETVELMDEALGERAEAKERGRFS